ncbi:MAG: CDP-glucose 4,6-dehydratase [Candidatus Delongbacteria bacterium]|nr:CDP-glucose 4,6-dehydratase [Candidatus Delongbacteria bacterium]
MENMVNRPFFHDIYRNKRVLITGHTGFKGSWLIAWLERIGAQVAGFSNGIPTQPSHFELLKRPVKSYWGNIVDYESICQAIHEFQPEIVYHMAAQSLVLPSYHNPILTYQTNLMGTLNVYEACREVPSVKVVIGITTDKVYQNQEWSWGYRENDRLGGYDPYSSSKACVEIMSQSYRSSFLDSGSQQSGRGFLLATVRAGNVIGGGDWADYRLIPDIMRAVSQKQPVIIRSPQSVRPWQHVLEPLSGYLWLGTLLLEEHRHLADAWNFGPVSTQFKRVVEMVDVAQTIWPEIQYRIETQTATAHETGCLRLDSSKSLYELDWRPVWHDEAIERTIGWYRNFYQHQILLTHQDIDDYCTRAISDNLCWTRS